MSARADYLALGDWNAACWQCGRKRKASELRRHWQGYWVCAEHWEPRQEQDFVRATLDTQTPPWTQPPPATNRFLSYSYVYPWKAGGTTLGGDGNPIGDPGQTNELPLMDTPPTTLTDEDPTGRACSGTLTITIPEGTRISPLTTGGYSFVLPDGWDNLCEIVIINQGQLDTPPSLPTGVPVTVLGNPYGSIGILYTYITEANYSSESVLSYVATQHPGFDPFTDVYTHIVTVTGVVGPLTIGSFATGSVVQLINRGSIMGTGGTGASNGNGGVGGTALTVSQAIVVAIDNSAGYILGGGGGGGRSGYVDASAFPASTLYNYGQIQAGYAPGGGGPGYTSVGGALVSSHYRITVAWTEGAGANYSVTLDNTLGTLVPTHTTGETPLPTPTQSCTQVMTTGSAGGYSGVATPIAGAGGLAYIATGSATGNSGNGGAGADGFGEAGHDGEAATGTGDEDYVTILAPGAGGAGGYAISYVAGASITIGANGNNSTQIKGTVGTPP